MPQVYPGVDVGPCEGGMIGVGIGVGVGVLKPKVLSCRESAVFKSLGVTGKFPSDLSVGVEIKESGNSPLVKSAAPKITVAKNKTIKGNRESFLFDVIHLY